ncbi:MAG: TATA-box-binding protein [Candidatus Altiarchaeota archaeon]|nr:TATA-box-binding protein [Candidatus Altiarchaeota archaeon]
MSYKIAITNMVAEADFGVTIDLKDFVSKTDGVEYTPEIFSGVIYRLHEPKITALIFSSGKSVLTGALSEENIGVAVDKVKAKLLEAGIKVKSTPCFEVQNIVASADLGSKINLDQLAIESLNTEYEPEQFPGLVFRIENPKTVILVFATGKLVLTGAKKTSDLYAATDKTRDMITDSNAFIR